MIIRQKFIARQDAQANPEVIYVFGDNADRVGRGGQAAELRGEPNAFGIVTKKGTYHCFKDIDTEEAKSMIIDDLDKLQLALDKVWQTIGFEQLVVWPSSGIGTGLAHMPQPLRKWLDNEILVRFGIVNCLS